MIQQIYSVKSFCKSFPEGYKYMINMKLEQVRGLSSLWIIPLVTLASLTLGQSPPLLKPKGNSVAVSLPPCLTGNVSKKAFTLAATYKCCWKFLKWWIMIISPALWAVGEGKVFVNWKTLHRCQLHFHVSSFDTFVKFLAKQLGESTHWW